MNKVSTLALAGLMGVAMTANASVSRWDGFGNIGAAFIADVQDIWTLPGVVTNYKSALYVELGENAWGYESGTNDGIYGDCDSCDGEAPQYQDFVGSLPWGGFHLELGPGVLGVWVNRPHNESWTNVDIPAWGSPTTPRNTLDLIYGWALSEETTLAVGLNRAADGYTGKYDEPAAFAGDYTYTQTSSDLGIALGLEQKNVGPISLLEVGLTYNMGSFEYKDKSTASTWYGVNDNKWSASGSDMDLRVGGDMAGEDGAFSRFELGLAMDSAVGKKENLLTPFDPASDNVENTYGNFGYNLGYAVGKSSDKGLGLVGVMFSSSTETYVYKNDGNVAGDDTKYSDFLSKLVVGFAGEGKVNSWLTFRGGLTADVLVSDGYENKYTRVDLLDSTETYSDDQDGQDAQASFGTSITFGNFTLDGVLNQSLFYTGSYLVSGVSNGLSTKVSGTFVY